MEIGDLSSISTLGVEQGTAVLTHTGALEQPPQVALQPMSTTVPRYGQQARKIPVSIPRYTLPINIFWICIFALVVFSFYSLNLDYAKIVSRAGNMGGVVLKLSRLTTDKFDVAIGALLESVTVTILATVYGFVIGLVVGGLAAENITPWKPLSYILQCFFSLLRAVPTVIWALLVLVCLGFSPATGIVGMLFHVVAFFGRAFA